ncbi:MAG: amidohydrolase [Bacteroidota bacterium]|nr:amidohydrolase [Bacteroidota bacterium]MDE2834125.1 amidohydrolase [Bacteroidota bacterium]
MKFRLFTLTLVSGCILLGCSSDDPYARLVLTNGKIVTVDAQQPEVEALAVMGDTIAAVGSSADIAAYIGDGTEVIDLEGRLAIPGLIEGHGHYMGLGEARMILDLTTAKSWEDIVNMVAEAAETAESGEWITGRGWHQEKWDSLPPNTVDGVPSHHSLSAVSPDNPVLLRHASGHAAFANRAALNAAGISPETPNPEGGELIRDARGELTGLLRETAQSLVGAARARARESMTDEERAAEARQQSALAAQESLAKGITSFHDAGVSFATVDMFRQLADEGELPVRLYVMIRASSEALAANLTDYRMIGYGNNFLTVRSVKRSIDGALGSHGAWLLEPYSDMPGSVGLVTVDPEEVRRTAEISLEHGFQVCIHAIGDRANHEVLNIFEDLYGRSSDQDLRWRIEHAQHVHPDDIPRFGALGVIASMQGVHATSDGPWVYRRLGEERAESGAYRWQTLWQSDALVTNGTDAPVEDVDPIASFHATVTRQLQDGTVFFPDERLTREQALQSYTLNNAIAAFEEDIKGTLTSGKLADITVLSRDIMTIPDSEILETEVLYTIVGGNISYRKYDD